MVDTLRIESGRTPDQTVYFVPFLEQQLCQIRTILAGNPGNQGFFHELFLINRVSAAPLNGMESRSSFPFRQSSDI
jgi:hypothetical protein